MLSQNLPLLKNLPNVVSMSQADVDIYKIDDDSTSYVLDTVDLFSNRAKSHMSYQYVKFHLDNNFKYFDFVKIPKYPLLAVYNKSSKKCLINISATLKSNVQNIEPRDLYTMVLYSHCCSCLSNCNIQYNDVFCDFFYMVLIKIFGKKYGITGSYLDLIPQFKYIVSCYMMIRFFGFNFSEADKKAKAFSKYDSNNLFEKLSPSNYDLNNIEFMIKLLSDSGTCPGINKYRFLENIIKYFGTMNLSIFEDLMRLCSTLYCCSINSNSFFPQSLQLQFARSDYEKIMQIVEKCL